MNILNNKYLLATMVAKRTKQLRLGAKPLVESKNKKFIIVALEEIIEGKVFIKEKKESLKAEEIFNKVEDEVEKSVKPKDLSNEDKEPGKPEDLSNEVKELEKSEELSDEDEKPAKVEEIFNKDKESGKSEG